MATKPSASSEVQYYLNHIASYDREFTKWETRANRILKRYRDDSRGVQDGTSKFNILWSNVQTLKAATFARMPRPDVSRRFRDNDPVGRVAALILERALDYEISHYTDYREALMSCVYDRFLGGRGVAWVRYEPKFTQAPAQGLPDDGVQITEDQDSEGQEEAGEEMLDYECAPSDYVHWRDFGHDVARTWEEVSMVWRKVYMTRAMLRERFPDQADKVPLDAEPQEMKNASKEGVDKRALVYEIWDKQKGQAIWLSKSLGKVLDQRDDPLQLQGFYPCPKPLYATLTNETLVPIPDFAMYQDQANDLDILSERIDGLVKALQVKGVYNAAVPELARLFTEGSNNDLIPVNNWMAFAETKGLAGALDLIDIQPIAQTLINSYQAFDQIKSQIYDITGISDIVRGQSAASETATAQQIKGQYASLRLKVYQDDVARFASHLLQLKAQIICKHFSRETIMQIADVQQFNPADLQYVEPAMELLTDEPMRTFRIEVSSDSMVMANESQEKQDRVEFLTAVGGFLEKAVQATQAAPQIAPLVLDLLKFGVTGYKVGRTVEGMIDSAADNLRQQLEAKQKAPQQPPPPDPEQMKQQAEMQRFQMEQQFEQQKHADQLQQEERFQQMKMQGEYAIAQLKAQSEEKRIQAELAAAEVRAESEARKAQIDAEAKLLIAKLDAAKVESERLSAQMQDSSSQQMGQTIAAALDGFKVALEGINKPKTIKRGVDGIIVGIE
jgi:hypothetical protein